MMTVKKSWQQHTLLATPVVCLTVKFVFLKHLGATHLKYGVVDEHLKYGVVDEHFEVIKQSWTLLFIG